MKKSVRTCRIVIIVESPLTLRTYKRFGIQYFLSLGIEVEIWDLTPYLYPKNYEIEKVELPIGLAPCRCFTSPSELMIAFQKLSCEDLIINFCSYDPRTIPLFRECSRKNVRYAVTTVGAVPEFWRENYTMNLNASPINCMGVQVADYLLAAGRKSMQYNYPVGMTTRVIWAHYWDYDVYLEELSRPTVVPKDQIVFCDENYLAHPDSVRFGLEQPITRQQYRGWICNLFAQIEQRYGCEIVIAAHPSSRTEDCMDIYGGRQVFRDSTCALVRHSKFVLLHASASVAFAVLFKKPVVYVTNSLMQRDYRWNLYQMYFAAWLGKNPICIDNNFGSIDWLALSGFQNEAYINFQEEFIKIAGSPSKPMWEIFCDNVFAK